MRKNPDTSRTTIGLASMAIVCTFAALPAAAAELATATLSATELSPTSWQYSITLNDVGTTKIGTFWFAWIPGQDYMPTQPTNVTGASSWTDVVTHAGSSDGYAIQWVASSRAALKPGDSVSGFTFDSTTSPQQMAGNSPFYPGTPVTTSFVYSGGPFSDGGYEFVVQSAPVPEPSTMALLAVGALAMAAWIPRRRSRRGA